MGVDMYRQRFVAGVLCFVLAGIAHGATWYVDRDAAADGDGMSWASAFREIQPAVEAAGDAGGGDVWIAEGLYNTAGNPSTGTIVALREGVSLYGGFAGTESSLEARDIEAHPTVLDASTSREGEPGRHILRSTFPATLDGLIFESARLESVLFYRWSGTATVDHCTFRNYRGEWYFALHFDASIGNSGSGGSAVVTDSLFLNNGEVGMVATEADSVEVCSSHFWGNSVGLGQYRVKTCSVRECSFLYNHRGGALWCHVGYPAPLKPLLVEQCWFEGNTSALEGGAINFDSDEYCLEGGPPEITNCVILNNQSGGFYGGAVCVLFDDTSRKSGVASPESLDVRCSGDYARIHHCTFVGNTCVSSTGCSALGGFGALGYHCVFQGNSEPDIQDGPVPLYSVYQGDHTETWYHPEDQIPGAPGMLDPEHGNMRLKPGSPGTNLVQAVSALSRPIMTVWSATRMVATT